jgi:hypothetical protein
MNKEDILGTIIIFFLAILVVIGIIYYNKNSSTEVIHQFGTVIDQNYEHWVTIDYQYDSDGNIIGTKTIDHYKYETKVKIDNEDVVFTDDRKSVYENTAKDQKVKVLRKDRYFKKKYTGTNYYVEL